MRLIFDVARRLSEPTPHSASQECLVSQAPDNPAAAWLSCARRPEVAAAIDAVYVMIADQVAARGPACWASGRCCNFAKAGHRLYTTGLEAAYCVARLDGPTNPTRERGVALPLSERGATHERGATQQAAKEVGSERRPTPSLTPAALAAAVERGDCPFLVSQLCGVHTLKPAACRIYFCDQAATKWQNDLAERVHAQIRGLHDRHAIPYRYGEWRELLGFFLIPAYNPAPRRNASGET